MSAFAEHGTHPNCGFVYHIKYVWAGSFQSYVVKYEILGYIVDIFMYKICTGYAQCSAYLSAILILYNKYCTIKVSFIKTSFKLVYYVLLFFF